MKKNKMMRLASVLLVLTLLSTSVISGTFAKYITTDSANDSARVAKWGVVASVKGDLFGQTYEAATGNNIINYNTTGGTVIAEADTDFVVAPGTENKQGLSLSVNGTPEVASRVILDPAEDENGKDYANSEIYLEAGVYGVMVQYNGVKTAENCNNYFVESSGTYTVAQDTDLDEDWYELNDQVTAEKYYPLDWYVDDVKVDSQSAVVDALKTAFNDKTFTPNQTINLSKKVGWVWSWTGTNGAEWTDENGTLEKTVLDDQMDTVLGNMMVGETAKVVKQNTAGNYVAVTYAEVEADLDDVTGNCANMVTVAKVDDTIVACLTVAFNARLTVEQVD